MDLPLTDLYFDFYDVITRLRCHSADTAEALFYFGGQRVEPAAPERTEVVVTLSCPEWPERGFFTSLLRKDGLTKRIEVDRRTEDGWRREVDHTFTDWSELPSPLPPFRYSRLWERLAVGPGTCLELADGTGVLLTGDNYIGKTSAALVLCSRGARLVSDSLAVLDVDSGSFLRHDSPLGFRREGRRHHLARILDGEHRETVSPDTGLVLLARAAQFLGRPNLGRTDVKHLVRLVPSEQASTGPTDQRTDPAVWFSGASRRRISEQLPERTLVVGIPDGAGPEQVADLIEARLAATEALDPAC
ncbi:hypothetical protein ACFQ6N_35490 [Kitasatospora sp. NPDC056446]|uniref:hypothetical protein n=1 Tax=Kitasatospora sp. NPDC056446 TaxID=3345819 RepID=UPI00367E3217